MKDHELLQQFVRDRSQTAFRTLVERHTNWLYSVCLRRLRDPALAEDATQAVFLALAQKAPSLLHEPTLSPWLHRAAKFVAANILRAQARRTHHESEAAAMTPTSTPPREWQTLEPDLEPALDRLPFPDRQILLLRFYEQKSNPEIAAALAISEPAAAKRLSRALDRLRQILSPNSPILSSTTLNSLLLSHTITLAPAHLAAAAAVSTTTSALAKGALTAMALAKLQTAALIIATACLLIAIPTTVIVLQHNSSPAPEPVATTAPATAPDDFLAYYSLQPDESLKIVIDAPPEARAAFLAQGDPTRMPPPPGKFITIRWDNGHPYLWGYGDTVPLDEIFEAYLGFYPQTLDLHLPNNAALSVFKGDLVLRDNATPEQYRASLQTILSKSLGAPVNVSFREVTEKAIVLRGDWHYTPNLPHAEPEHGRSPILEIFGPNTDKNMNIGILATGDRNYFAGQLGQWIHQPVLIESDNFPSAVTAHFNTENPTDPHSRDKTLILNHLTEQTGLTWSEETRPVRHLVIESASSTPALTAPAEIPLLTPNPMNVTFLDLDHSKTNTPPFALQPGASWPALGPLNQLRPWIAQNSIHLSLELDPSHRFAALQTFNHLLLVKLPPTFTDLSAVQPADISRALESQNDKTITAGTIRLAGQPSPVFCFQTPTDATGILQVIVKTDAQNAPTYVLRFQRVIAPATTTSPH